MRPSDPRLRRQLLPARVPLAVVVGLGVAGSLLLVAQAVVVTGLIVAAVDGTGPGGWAAGVVAVFVARALVAWAGDVAAAHAAAVVGRDLRRRVVEAIVGRRAGGVSTGALSALATRGVAAAEPYLTRYVPTLVLAGVLPVVTLVAIAVLDPWSALIVLVTLPLIPVFGILVGLATRDRAASQWRAMADLSGHFLDVMRGLPTLVAFRRARAQSDAIRAVTHRYRERTVRTLRIAFLSSATLELAATISVALVAVTVGIRLADGGLGLRTALTVLLLAPEAYWPLRRVGAEFHAAAEGVATFEATAELADEAGADEGGRMPAGALAVEAVSVTYPGRVWPALAPTSATIPDRGVTALVGPSGCGKSTLLAVLAGLLEPTSGYVHAGARRGGGDGWRSAVALLPQRPVFLAGSVADNLRLAAPGAGDDELWQALADVALADRVRALPLGLATPLGEDGAGLSAGERARLALARVVLADRPWVLLDEPTAHLDPLTESVVAETVTRLGRTRAVVVVAHRPALVALADRVIELMPPALADVEPASHAKGPLRTSNSPREAGLSPVDRGKARRHGMALPTLLGALSWASGTALTATAGWLIVRASYHPVILTLTVAMLGVRTFGIARPVLRYLERVRSHDVVLRMLAERRVAVYDALVPLVPGRLGRRRGDVLAAVVDDVDCVLDEELRVRLPVRGLAIVGVLAAVTAVFVETGAAVAIALVAAVGGGLGYLIARSGAARAEAILVDSRARLSETVVEAVQTADELAMWQAGEAVVAKVDAIGARWGRATRMSAGWLGLGKAVALAASGVGVALVVVLAHGHVSAPLVAFLALLPMTLGEPMTAAAEAGAVAARTAAAERRLADLTAQRPAVADPADPLPAPAGSAVGLHDLAATWADTEVFAGLDLGLAPGEKVAVVGPSGSGKSTLAALLLRFVDPVAGRVTLDEVGYRDLALDEVRGRIGLVDDDPHVFASTVAENVRLARPGSSDAEVERALRGARLGPWLEQLPDGLATRLGDGSAAVSGGERARLAVARSLLADQPVLVLDEPAAHLDSATADELAEQVLGEAGRTVVWISHARAGLDAVDRTIALGGRD